MNTHKLKAKLDLNGFFFFFKNIWLELNEEIFLHSATMNQIICLQPISLFYLYVLTFGPQLRGTVVEMSHRGMGQPFENTLLFLCSLVDRGRPFVLYHYVELDNNIKICQNAGLSCTDQ